MLANLRCNALDRGAHRETVALAAEAASSMVSVRDHITLLDTPKKPRPWPGLFQHGTVAVWRLC